MATNKEKRYETDLYAPIRDYFMKKGFTVHGEVQHCDLTAVLDDELIVVELKLGLTVDLLVQAAKRQRLTDNVYIAIPKPKTRLSSKKWQDICHLVKRLELGLMVVSFLKSGAKVEVLISPTPFDRAKSMQRNKKKRERILAEIKGRHADYNVGGSNKTKIMTAYKENCIHIAYLLEKFGALTPKKLREMGAGDKTLSILTKNYYGWFEKVQRGIYSINDKGKQELADYPEHVKYFTEK
ncbi:DUF2161 domain-containing phosphodiesterase [Neobacillus sp. PS3-34]|uniref:DUF2161 domain-containing phosphodiesterase n=1 Tax=Neobacillus sp. PS3-34 TaxID=3070678 RepID=UPI0035A5DA54